MWRHSATAAVIASLRTCLKSVTTVFRAAHGVWFCPRVTQRLLPMLSTKPLPELTYSAVNTISASKIYKYDISAVISICSLRNTARTPYSFAVLNNAVRREWTSISFCQLVLPCCQFYLPFVVLFIV
jgi:hypothetical protein